MDFIAQKTDSNLLARLRAAAQKQLTREEIEQQRVSFVYSVVGDGEYMTRERVEEMLENPAVA